MAAIFGLTINGLVIPTIDEIRTDINAALQQVFGVSIDLGDTSIFGQIAGILAERIGAVWELLEVVNSARDPDKAFGTQLEAVCAFTGTRRTQATSSIALMTLTGTPATLVVAGGQITTVSTGEVFATIADATIVALPAYDNVAGVYVVGNRVTNASRAYQCTVGGSAVGSGTPPTSADAIIVDTGALRWTYLGEGTGAIDTNAASVNGGRIAGIARDIRSMAVAGGWKSAINLADAVLGQPVLTDEQLRALRISELAGDGNSPQDAIRAHLLEVIPDVVAVTVFTNNTDVTNADGMPPHSVEALVRVTNDSTHNQAVWDALLANVAAGIATTGSTVGSAVDSQGTSWTMKFSHPTEVPIYVAISVTKDPLTYPADGDAQIKAAIVTYGQGLAIGRDAVSSAIGAQAFGIDGVLDVTACLISNAPGPTLPTTIPISLRQLATFATANLAVTSVDGTP